MQVARRHYLLASCCIKELDEKLSHTARYSRDTAEIQPRYSRDTAEIQPRYSRDTGALVLLFIALEWPRELGAASAKRHDPSAALSSLSSLLGQRLIRSIDEYAALDGGASS